MDGHAEHGVKAAGGFEFLLVGGSPQPSSCELVRSLAARAHRVIAIDRGAEVLEAAGVAPWAYVGDSDSVGDEARAWAEERSSFELLRPSHKDQTDLALALDVVEERVPTSIPTACCVTCVTGGRLDHQLGVIGTLMAHAVLEPVIVEDTFCAWLLAPHARRTITFAAQDVGKTLSVLALESGTVVSERGFTWDLAHHALKALSDLGVSNVVEKPGATVACEAGYCLVVLNETI